MSQLHSEGKGDFAQGFSKSYVSTKNFQGEFYSYVASKSALGVSTGVFTLVTSTAANCPAGRVLHATGRKLFPGMNPMTTFVGALSTPKFLIAVSDPVTFLNGFIDPSSSTFAKYDQNVPNSFNLGAAGVPPLGGQAGKLSATDTGSPLSVTAYTSNTVSLNATTASVGAVSIASGIGGAATNTIVISTSAATDNSTVLLTNTTVKSTITDIFVSAVAAGSFTVTVVTSANTAAVTGFNWLVVN